MNWGEMNWVIVAAISRKLAGNQRVAVRAIAREMTCLYMQSHPTE